MDASVTTAVVKQHLIDPEICIRCNTCEETCPVHAITHDARNYVVDFAVCNGCKACIAPCPNDAAADTLPPDIAALVLAASAGQGGVVPPPWSAEKPSVNLYATAKPAKA